MSDGEGWRAMGGFYARVRMKGDERGSRGGGWEMRRRCESRENWGGRWWQGRDVRLLHVLVRDGGGPGEEWVGSGAEGKGMGERGQRPGVSSGRRRYWDKR